MQVPAVVVVIITIIIITQLAFGVWRYPKYQFHSKDFLQYIFFQLGFRKHLEEFFIFFLKFSGLSFPQVLTSPGMPLWTSLTK